MDNEYLESEGLYNPDGLINETATRDLFGDGVSHHSSNFKTEVVRPNDWLNDGRTLISRQWHYVMPACLVAYVILQILSTQTALCSHREPFSEWTFHVGVGVASCFCTSVCCNAINAFAVESWSQRETDHLRAVYASAATLNLLGGSSAVLSLITDTVCRDALGIDTSRHQWPEWIIAAPLLAYITIAIEDKRNLAIEDITIIFMMVLWILLFFLMNIRVSMLWGVVLFVLSSLCLTVNLILAVRGGMYIKNSQPAQLRAQQWFLGRMRTKNRLARILFWIFPLFMLVHVLGKEDESTMLHTMTMNHYLAYSVFDRHLCMQINRSSSGDFYYFQMHERYNIISNHIISHHSLTSCILSYLTLPCLRIHHFSILSTTL